MLKLKDLENIDEYKNWLQENKKENCHLSKTEFIGELAFKGKERLNSKEKVLERLLPAWKENQNDFFGGDVKKFDPSFLAELIIAVTGGFSFVIKNEKDVNEAKKFQKQANSYIQKALKEGVNYFEVLNLLESKIELCNERGVSPNSSQITNLEDAENNLLGFAKEYSPYNEIFSIVEQISEQKTKDSQKYGYNEKLLSEELKQLIKKANAYVNENEIDPEILQSVAESKKIYYSGLKKGTLNVRLSEKYGEKSEIAAETKSLVNGKEF